MDEEEEEEEDEAVFSLGLHDAMELSRRDQLHNGPRGVTLDMQHRLPLR